MPADQRPGPPLGRSGLHRRSEARTAVVWSALREVLEARGAPASVVDIGGGTGGFAVRVAELGHRVVVIDPSPDALAALARRADESGVADLVTGRQGDLDDLLDLVPEAGSPTDTPTDTPTGPGPGFDVALSHGVLEIVDDPAGALDALARVLRPGGTLSLLVSQRHAAVVARAMAGHFQQARTLLDSDGVGGPNRRFTADEVTGALDRAGFETQTMHAVRVFVDLVPGALVDLEPGAAQALVDLEREVASRPEYLALATQIHTLAARR